MTAATGPPPSMADDADELTPMLSQYFELCEAYEDALLLFQVGDFYEAFCEAAEEVARTCEVTLTKREDSTGSYPMAGIPIDNAATYVEPLLEAGYRVAIADQVEDPDEASGLVDRAVTRIVTPGTVVDDELLDPATPTYVACVTAAADDPGGGTGHGSNEEASDRTDARTHALAVVDVSTGECRATSAGPDRIVEELERLGPAELLSGPAADLDLATCTIDPMRTDYEPDAFELEVARDRVENYVPVPDAVLENDAEIRACGAALAYAEYTQGDDGVLSYVSRITRYDPRTYVQLDATAQRGLELFESRSPREGEGETVLSVIDETACAMGRRRLADWLRRPSLSIEAIEARHDAVEELVASPLVRTDLHDRLREVYDLERLIARASRGRANARDLRALLATLEVVPDLKASLADADSDRLQRLCEDMDELADVRSLIDRAIRPDPPQEVTEGGVIREGFDEELDDLRATEREGREWVADLEQQERERTGIDSLEVGYNQVHGYYIEVTNPNLDRVPEDYTRRQTLKNAERFYTPELKRREDEILSAEERADALEYDLFCDVRDRAAAEADRANALARAMAQLDALTALAIVAAENDYVRPDMGGDGIEIEAGRHPVVERTQDSFVPNDADLTDAQIAVITGPNMSGKSTYMRQVALICVLAQVGSFVPADGARLPILDRVFTRVGASDDIAGGQSTFMREMAELTDILHAATEDSLVLLDEVGRGTSTADGLAIARATTEFLHDEVGATTMFATHYHDLTDVAADLDDAVNLHFQVRQNATRRQSSEGDDGDDSEGDDGDDSEGDDGDETHDAHAGDAEGVTFLHRVAEGASSSSYGVEVANLAGVPHPVVERSRELIANGDVVESERDDEPTDEVDASTNTNGSASLDAFVRDDSNSDPTPGHDVDPKPEPDPDVEPESRSDPEAEPVGNAAPSDEVLTILDDLDALDLAQTTPIEALNALNDLQQRLEDARE